MMHGFKCKVHYVIRLDLCLRAIILGTNRMHWAECIGYSICYFGIMACNEIFQIFQTLQCLQHGR